MSKVEKLVSAVGRLLPRRRFAAWRARSAAWWRALRRYVSPRPEGMDVGDRFMLRWLGISFIALALVVLLSFAGLMEVVELEQIRILAGSPFFISAEEVQVSLLGVGGTFALCLVVALWLTAVLLRERRFAGRLQLMVVLMVVLAMPGLLCVLWGGVLNMAAPMLTALLCWLGAELRPLERALRHRWLRR